MVQVSSVVAVNATAALLQSTIPAKLTARDQWVCWRKETREGKPTKVPYQTDGRKADTTDPTTWTTFEAVCTASGFDGIGYVLSADDPFAGVDLDKCRNPDTGKLRKPAAAIVNTLNSYTEVSPSGAGIRVFVQASSPGTRKRKGGVEIYTAERFLTVTGNRVPDTPATIQARQKELAAVYAKIFTAVQNGNGAAPPPRPSVPVDLDDDALLRKMFAGTNGAKIRSLWGGDWSAYPSQSEADAALCFHLAFWTDRDAARVDSLFRHSGLMRDKWDERRGDSTIGANLVRDAIENVRDGYRSSANDKLGKVIEHPAVTRQTTGSSEIELIDPADVEMTDIVWLIQDFARANTYNQLQGHGGTNKGTLCCYIGAQATRGELSEDKTPMMVLFACAEDDHSDVLKPRLVAAGADLRYVRFVDGLELPIDIANGRLERAIRSVNARILFIDPIVTYLEKIDTHKDQEVKKALTPILDIASKERCTIFGVLHFGKDTSRGLLLSANGSGAFGNTARIVLAMVKDDEDENLRILEVVKSNGGVTGARRLLELELKEVPPLKLPQVTLVDKGASEKSAGTALAASIVKARVPKDLIQAFVRRHLADGAMPRVTLNQFARDELEISGDTLYKQGLVPMKDAGEIMHRQIIGGGWEWYLLEKERP